MGLSKPAMLTSHNLNLQALPAGHLKTPSLGGGGPPSSPRNSPFRRPVSPATPSALRQITPSASPLKAGQVNNTPRFAATATSAPSSPSTPTGTAESLTPRGKATPPPQPPADDMFGSPRQRAPPVSTASTAPTTVHGNGNALSQLQPAQVRTLREGFQILDRDTDGVVNREDVTDMLSQLGMEYSQPHFLFFSFLLLLASSFVLHSSAARKLVN